MSRAIAILAVLATALSLAACGERSEPELASTTPAPQFEITGRWRGELRQQGEKPFPVQATIASLERFKQNTVHYAGNQAPQQRRGSATPRIDCSGTWEYLGASETAYRFHEVIDRGQSRRCKGSGTVTLTPLTDNSVAYEFQGGGVASQGDLQRISPAKSG
jgi:hypothetical protein